MTALSSMVTQAGSYPVYPSETHCSIYPSLYSHYVLVPISILLAPCFALTSFAPNSYSYHILPCLKRCLARPPSTRAVFTFASRPSGGPIDLLDPFSLLDIY
jgi:hypothetical protein